MAENTEIAWCDHTFSPWHGCEKISPGCANCYAAAMSRRNPAVLGEWGPHGTRVVAAEAKWKLPLKWDREAKRSGVRAKVFCASIADVFENWQGAMLNSKSKRLQIGPDGKWFVWESEMADREDLAWVTIADIRRRLFDLIDATPNLDWILVTKRPENIRRMMPLCLCVRKNVWLMTSVESADQLHRIDTLKACRSLTPVLGLSIEPLLGPMPTLGEYLDGIDWVIVGGESGRGARPCDVAWIRSVMHQCQQVGVPAVFIKQLGANIVTRNDMIEDAFSDGRTGWPEPHVEHNIHGFREEYQGADVRIRLTDKKGGDMAEWPEDLRVQEFPLLVESRKA